MASSGTSRSCVPLSSAFLSTSAPVKGPPGKGSTDQRVSQCSVHFGMGWGDGELWGLVKGGGWGHLGSRGGSGSRGGGGDGFLDLGLGGEEAVPRGGRGGVGGARRLCVRGAGRSKAQPRARPKPKIKNKPLKGFDRPNLRRRGRRGPLNPQVTTCPRSHACV